VLCGAAQSRLHPERILKSETTPPPEQNPDKKLSLMVLQATHWRAVDQPNMGIVETTTNAQLASEGKTVAFAGRQLALTFSLAFSRKDFSEKAR
jgi:hypothetical protein